MHKIIYDCDEFLVTIHPSSLGTITDCLSCLHYKWIKWWFHDNMFSKTVLKSIKKSRMSKQRPFKFVPRCGKSQANISQTWGDRSRLKLYLVSMGLESHQAGSIKIQPLAASIHWLILINLWSGYLPTAVPNMVHCSQVYPFIRHITNTK